VDVERAYGVRVVRVVNADRADPLGLSSSGVSVLVPVYREGSLESTLVSVKVAASALQMPVEILLLVQGQTDAPVPLPKAPEGGAPVQVLRLPKPGKFAALRVGAAAARGSVLVLVDADCRPEADALVLLLAPILSGAADVCAARQVLTRCHQRSHAGVIHDWSRVTTEAWHLLRTRHSELLWALPGPLYAIRREFFPTSVLVPLIDDASVGIEALEQGARFIYASDAVAFIDPSPSYLVWCSQKLRTRRGWELLRRRRGERIGSLLTALRGCLSETTKDEPTIVRLVLWHDRQLRRIAKLTASEAKGQAGSWRPLRRRSHP